MRFPTMWYVRPTKPQIYHSAHTRRQIRARASLSVKLLTEPHLEFLSLKEAADARLSQHLSKCHIVGNHISWLKSFFIVTSRHADCIGDFSLRTKKKKNETESAVFKLCKFFYYLWTRILKSQ